jgi:uncharacterized membrane protein
MVLELRVPEAPTFAAFRHSLPLLGAYLLSFVNVGIYWMNHHHLLHLAKRVNGNVLLANLFLLFWLSLLPFVIRWSGEADFAPMPVAAYGLVLTMAAAGYLILERAIIDAEGRNSAIRKAVKSAFKERLSVVLYLLAIPSAYVSVWIAIGMYAVTTGMWLLPDRRVEERLPDPD